ncbi:unnamed protein product [Polarella glacialis]|uniref:Uncharacterized protein n=1 Tax=Polarella glacialis TaxID=89957 RepID=A0A813FGS2_POLGL|nr:unnamed protein product [Polarella glacialis]
MKASSMFHPVLHVDSASGFHEHNAEEHKSGYDSVNLTSIAGACIIDATELDCTPAASRRLHCESSRAEAMPSSLVAVGFSAALTAALPKSLADFRLDICCRNVGDEGAHMLASAIPVGLKRLALCLRDWRFTDNGARALALAIPIDLRHLKIVMSCSGIGSCGAQALVAAVKPGLQQLNLSFRQCGIGRDGEQALSSLARRWNAVPGSWVRVRKKTSPVCQALDGCAEWELWDD